MIGTPKFQLLSQPAKIPVVVSIPFMAAVRAQPHGSEDGTQYSRGRSISVRQVATAQILVTKGCNKAQQLDRSARTIQLPGFCTKAIQFF